MRAVLSSLAVRILRFILAPRRLSDISRVAYELTQLVAGAGIPDAGGGVVAAGEDFAFIRAPRRLVDIFRVAYELDQLVAGGGIPDAGGVVVAGGEDFAFIRAPRRLIDSPRVACELTSSSPLPASQMRAVSSSLPVRILLPSGLHVACRTSVVPASCDQLGAGGDIPDAGGAVVAGGEDFAFIPAPRRLVDITRVAYELDQLVAGAGIPDAGGAVVVAAGEDLGFVLAPRRLSDTSRVAYEFDAARRRWPASQMRAVPSSLGVRILDSSRLHVA